MWPRVVEITIACWLAMSPFIFKHPDNATLLWVLDLGAAAAVFLFATLACWPPTRYAHLGQILVGCVLVAVAYITSFENAMEGVPAAQQNHVLVGLALLMFAIMPNEATLPPRAWRTGVS